MVSKTIRVVKPKEPFPQVSQPTFCLRQDRWNDYGFQTQYHLHYLKPGSNFSSHDLIGPVKILRKGQQDSDPLLVNEDFHSLGSDYCSVGGELDYYERISKFDKASRDLILNALRDVVQMPSLVAEFSGEIGWTKSVFRDQRSSNYLLLASGLLTGKFSDAVGKDVEFTLHVPAWSGASIQFSFAVTSLADDILHQSPLPERTIVLVGRNGAGKSTVLARLARLAYASVDEREKLANLGYLEPPGLGFSKIVTVGFSPFDSFRLPGAGTDGRQKLLDEVESGKGRFAFIGLRDIVEEEKTSDLAEANAVAAVTTALAPHLPDDRQTSSRLKSLDKLAREFQENVTELRGKKRIVQLRRLLTELLGKPTVDRMNLESQSAAGASFFDLSTGHKTILLIVSGLLAKLDPGSLVLIDEPETHLHPPLLAGLMQAIRFILEHQESFAVIATHSPVVVQETMAKHVRVVRREGDAVRISLPAIETFAENIGLITAEVFALHSENATTPSEGHLAVLDKLLQRYPAQADIEKLFLHGRMSQQGRSYVMSKRMRDKK